MWKNTISKFLKKTAIKDKFGLVLKTDELKINCRHNRLTLAHAEAQVTLFTYSTHLIEPSFSRNKVALVMIEGMKSETIRTRALLTVSFHYYFTDILISQYI